MSSTLIFQMPLICLWRGKFFLLKIFSNCKKKIVKYSFDSIFDTFYSFNIQNIYKYSCLLYFFLILVPKKYICFFLLAKGDHWDRGPWVMDSDLLGGRLFLLLLNNKIVVKHLTTHYIVISSVVKCHRKFVYFVINYFINCLN